ncbi:small ribosomal subunit Rsm22 family protein [Phreatobacter stygius]|uniref:Methyltransferase domain-containing protein n=1 Tax=Phreatobacter stygius TaxID=1940610 RepID=A0A4D7AV89_9HYPH|nr:small ribosomal subunit Rsm22 family protein [Phreatobacter stygius]QCI63651.1 methyltransferase domain-containing protein [Phreatobacter stygius]
MSGELPASLRAGLEALAAAHPGRALGEASSRLTSHYRGGHGTRLDAAVDLAAYAVARMPATYAAFRAVLDEVAARVDIQPVSVTDIGCGPGTAAWAVADAFPGIATATLVDAHSGMIGLGRKLAEAGPRALAGATWITAPMARHLAEAAKTDLVVAGYALNEIPPDEVAGIARQFYAAATGLVVIVEPGTPQGFAVIDRARAALIAAGGQVVAPCPHAGPCPLQTPDWCHFSARLPRLKAHKAAKGADVPFEDERYSYVAIAKPGMVIRPAAARVLRPPKATKPATLFRLCTADGLQDRTVAGRDRDLARRTRKTGWGDAFPADP